MRCIRKLQSLQNPVLPLLDHAYFRQDMDYSAPVDTCPVSVAIPAYGSEAALATSLQKIFECRPLPKEVLLHYDGNWEPNQDFTLDSPVPVVVIRSEVHLGPGGGRHRLIHNASCDIVACFDDDSWPLDKDYFAKATALMAAFPNAAIISPSVFLKEKPVLPVMAEASESVGFEGSASLTRRSMYLALPGYVPVRQPYGVEETDFSLQVHAAGHEILSSPWLRAWHNRPHADYQHGLEPWVANEVLLAYLRYPRWLQPWGWLRSLRLIRRHWTFKNAVGLLRALGSSPTLCKKFSSYCHRYSLSDIWRHHFTPRRRWLLGNAGTSSSGLPMVTPEPAPPSKRMLYLQYTNPAGYPPLQHSSQILASAGWQVQFLGIKGRMVPALEFPPFPRVKTQQMSWCEAGWKQKVHYLRFILWTLWHALHFRPDWVYASEPLAAPSARLIRWFTDCKVLYHEHDSPAPLEKPTKRFVRAVQASRQKLAATANAIVLPNGERLKAFIQEFAPVGRSFCVWNCPSLDEVCDRLENRPTTRPLTVLYHGSIVPDRFPISNIHVLAQCGGDVRLRLIGYETQGSAGYVDQLVAEAAQLGVGDRFEHLGTVPQRSELMLRCSECDVGLSLLRIHGGDINMLHMTGASNKPFDYLSQGLALIVPEDAEWKRLFVDKGCAVPCEPGNQEALVKVLKWLASHPEEVRRMGAQGKQWVKSEWNYESQFAPVLQVINNL